MDFFRRKKVSLNAIDAQTIITGDIRSENNWRLAGTLVGNLITLGDVTIEESADIDGDVTGENIWVAGKVRGNINAKQSLSISSTSKIDGNISYQTVEIADGASIAGKMHSNGTELELVVAQARSEASKASEQVLASSLNKNHYMTQPPKSEPAYAIKNKRIMIQ